MTWADLRAAVNSPRAGVVAIVGGLSALGGAVAGGVAALVAAAVLTPSEPVSAAQIVLMAIGYGFAAGLAGSVLGTIVAFGTLRRVPLGRLILCTNAGLAAGLTAGWLGGPWAWHHMGFLGCVGFSAGAALARAVSRGSPVPRSSLPFDSVFANGTIPSEPHTVVPTLTSPAELIVPADRIANRVRLAGPPEQ
jgi:MFS family permease